MREFVIKVTKPGAEITSTDPRDFLINSKYNTLKIAQEEYGSVSVPTSTVVTEDITHSLGYYPIVSLYFTHPEDGKWHAAPSMADINAGYSYAISCGWENLDTNTVRMSFFDNAGGAIPGGDSPVTVYYKCYIFIDPRKDAWYE